MQNNSKLQHLTDEQLKSYYKMIKIGNEKSSRFDGRKKYNADLKFLYHVVRLINEVEQILSEGDLDLTRNNDHLKAIRRGEVSFEEVKDWFSIKEKSLEKLYVESKLPYSPDQQVIKQLLLDCLEEHYGSISDCVVNPDQAVNALNEIKAVIEKYNK